MKDAPLEGPEPDAGKWNKLNQSMFGFFKVLLLKWEMQEL